jgi:hypothetical protein
VVSWAEASGVEELKRRHATLDNLRKESAATLTVLLAGLGGSLAYASKIAEPGQAGPVAFGAAALCVYLTYLAGGVVLRCMLTRDIPAVSDLPKHMAQKGETLVALKLATIENQSDSIEEMAKINARVNSDLRTYRTLAVFSPVVFAVAALAYKATPSTTIPDVLKLQCKAAAQQRASDSSFNCSLLP